jgi:hypothetical protein
MKRRKVAEATVILLECSLNFSCHSEWYSKRDSYCAQWSWQTWLIYLDYLLSLEVDSQAEREVSVTVHILSHRVYLFSFLRRTHLLWELYSHDWYHCMYLIGSTSFTLFLL